MDIMYTNKLEKTHAISGITLEMQGQKVTLQSAKLLRQHAPERSWLQEEIWHIREVFDVQGRV